ncbi:MAG: hypothetical protein J6O50_06055 [Ruminiclostridium sp.]|nr:hypothetical protein [Ruminiclostridium sp.]
MGIKTKIERQERDIHSQNRVVNSYASQLKSKVISDGHRKAILKEMQLEMTAEQFRKPVRRVYKHNAIRSYDDRVENDDSFDNEIQPIFNPIQTGGEFVRSVRNKVDNNYIHSARSNGYIHTAQLRFTGEAKKVVDEAKSTETRYNEQLEKQRFKMIFSSEQKKQERRKLEVQRHRAELIATSTPATAMLDSDRKYDPSTVVVETPATEMLASDRKYDPSAVVVGSPGNDMLESSENKSKHKQRKRDKNSNSGGDNLKNQKYIIAKADSDDSVAIEAVQTVTASVATAGQIGGYIRTAVGGTGKAAGKIATAVKSGHIFSRKSSIKDFGHIATAVTSGVANVAKDTGQQLIRTKIDKSKITDTGTETIKQGLTEIRYADNARKAVLNTARTTVKAGRAIKNMPRDTKRQMKNIKKNAKRAKKTVQNVGKVIGKILTSPVGKYILLAAGIIFLIIFLIMLIVTVIVALVNSLFGWLGDSSGSGSQRNAEEVVSGYTASVDAKIDDIRESIHQIVDEFVCDRRQFPPYEEITELNQFGNKVLNDIDSNEVIAILATLRYRDVNTDVGISEMMFTDAEIADVIERYYDFNYYYTYGHCDGCKEGHNEGGSFIYCDVDHEWLHGEVINYTLDDVLASYGFTEDERNMFDVFYGQVTAFGGG